MPRLRATILDARGRRVPLVPHEVTLHVGGDPVRNDRLKAAAGMGPKPTQNEIYRGVFFGLLAVPVLLVVAIMPSLVSTHFQLPWWGRVLVILPTALVPLLITVFVMRRVAGQRIAKTYVDAGYCASCGYDLGSHPKDASGLVQCPECGSSWRR